jgi:hypothetical protein
VVTIWLKDNGVPGVSLHVEPEPGLSKVAKELGSLRLSTAGAAAADVASVMCANLAAIQVAFLSQ